MTDGTPGLSDIRALLTRRPLVNAAVTRTPAPDGGVRVTVPVRPVPWRRWVKWAFPMSDGKTLDLDDLGAECLSWCDGETTVGGMIDRMQARWHLSFYEARGILLTFLRPLLKYRVIVLMTPPAEVESPPGNERGTP